MIGANAEQAEFWNAGPGQAWVRRQSDMDTLWAGVADLLIDLAAPQPGERVLDIGCGAGATTFRTADAVGPEGHVHGYDISEPLASHAEKRRRAMGVGHARFTVADAQGHPFDPGAYDLGLSRFGVMFFDDPAAAFLNIAAAIRAGGRLVFAAWDGPEVNPFFDLPQRIATERLRLDPAPTPDHAPGPMAFRDIGRVVGLLHDAGFEGAQGDSVAVDLHHPGGIEALRRILSDVGPLSRILRDSGADETGQQDVLDAVAEAFRAFDGPDGIRIPARVNYFTAGRA
jgi:SAM-dependent methyltransferase